MLLLIIVLAGIIVLCSVGLLLLMYCVGQNRDWKVEDECQIKSLSHDEGSRKQYSGLKE